MDRVDRLVLWDFDATLGFRPGMWSQTLVDALQAVAPGNKLTVADIRPHLSSGFPWHSADMSHPFAGDADGWWAHMAGVFRNAFVAAGCLDAVAGQAAVLVRQNYLDVSKWRVYSDSLSSLDRLAAAGWKNSIVSNHVPELSGLLDQLGFGDRFMHVVSSGDFGHEKPAPAIFEHAVALAGHPARVHMIGDSRTADVAGAENAGITGQLLERDAKPHPDGTTPLERIVERIIAGRH